MRPIQLQGTNFGKFSEERVVSQHEPHDALDVNLVWIQK